MRIVERQIKLLVLTDGKCPYAEWFDAIKDIKTSATIDARLARVASGNFGNHKEVGNGVYELKIDLGPGYRIYYAEYDGVVVVLLGGGTKKQQSRDIKDAIAMWTENKDDPKRLQRNLRP